MRFLSAMIILIVLWVIVASSDVVALSKEVFTEGKYVMGDLDTKQNARKLALMEAKRAALEQGGTYLESTSEVKNFSLTKDEIRSLTAGILSVEVIDEKWQMSGEALMVIIKVKATINIDDLEGHISSFKKNEETSEQYMEIQEKLASLQKELEEIKKSQAESPKKGGSPEKEAMVRYASVVKEMGALEKMDLPTKAMMHQDWDQAIHSYSQIIDEAPDQTRAYMGRAIAHFRNNQAKEAMNDLEIVLKRNPRIARAHFLKGMILFREEKYPEAIRSFVSAIQINPTNTKFYMMNGRAWLRLKKPGKALKNFKRACQLGDQKGCQAARKLSERLKEKRQRGQREPSPHKPYEPGR